MFLRAYRLGKVSTKSRPGDDEIVTVNLIGKSEVLLTNWYFCDTAFLWAEKVGVGGNGGHFCTNWVNFLKKIWKWGFFFVSLQAEFLIMNYEFWIMNYEGVCGESDEGVWVENDELRIPLKEKLNIL